MALHFILGGSGRGKSYYANHLISEMAEKEPECSFIMLVPEQFTMQTQREMVALSSRRGIINIEVQSFVRLAYRVFAEVGAGNLPVLDDMGKTMILRKVLLDREKSLTYFGKNIHKKGYVAELKSFLSELLQYGISQEKLQEMTEAVQDKPALARKLEDMRIAYQGFAEYLEDHYITSEEVLSVLRDVAAESELLRGSVICLDGFTGFTPVQYQLIEQLMICCREMYVTVTLGEGEELLRVGPKHRLFYMSRKTMAKLRELARRNQIEICPEIRTGQNIGQTRFAQAPGIEYLERQLFRYPVKPCPEKPEDISIHVLEQPEREVSFVVEQIMELRQRGSRYRDIAVVTGNMEIYGVLASEAFEKAGFPCFIDQKKSILVHPFVTMLSALMDIVISDFAYEPMIRYLRGRYAPFSRQDVDLLDNFLLASGIRGRRKWQTEWDGSYYFRTGSEEQGEGLNRRLNGIRESVWEHLGGFVEFCRRGKIRQADAVGDRADDEVAGCGITDIDRVDGETAGNGIEDGDRVDGEVAGRGSGGSDKSGSVSRDADKTKASQRNMRRDVEGYSRALALFLEENEFYRKICADVERFRQAGDLERVREYEQIYGIVIDVLDRLVELLGPEEMPISEYRELLDTGLSEARVGLIPPGVDQIMVGDITRTRLGHVDYLFFLGVNDCNIPKGSGSGGFLSAAERSYLEQEEYELAPTDREAVFTEQFYLYLNLTKPQRHLYICFCETGNDGKAQNPAYLVERVQRIFPDLSVTVERQRRDYNHILGDDEGFRYLIRGLRNENLADAAWKEIYRYYREEPERRSRLKLVLEAAFYREGKSQVTRKAAAALYQSTLRGSASQLERYASCAYGYFLQYGLRLAERVEHGVEFFDIGNIVHEALELYTRRLLDEGRKWQEIDENAQKERADRCLEEVTAHYKNGLLYDSSRDTWLIQRLRRILHRTVWAVTRQMEQGDFETVESELAFAQVQGPLRLVGRVDRVDEMKTETADYVTVIDYKTGRKDLSLSDLYYGLQMQLVIYLQAAVERRKRHGRMVVPAGIFYYNIEDPMLAGESGENRDQAILSELRLRGLINEDDPVLPSVDGNFRSEGESLPPSQISRVAPFETDKNGMLKKKSAAVTTEDFQLLMGYCKNRLVQMSQEILDGRIEIDPYRRMDASGETSCAHCPYHGVCRFDARLAGQSYRNLKKLSDDDVMEQLKKENSME